VKKKTSWKVLKAVRASQKTIHFESDINTKTNIQIEEEKKEKW
jgi:hypothetical protein